MELEQKAQEDLYLRVAGYLKQSFGELAEEVPGEDWPVWLVTLGPGCLLWVGVAPAGEDDAACDINGWLAEVPITPEVLRFLAEKNMEYRVGKLAVDDEDSICVQHSLFRESVTKDTLSQVLRILASMMNELNNELVMRFS